MQETFFLGIHLTGECTSLITIVKHIMLHAINRDAWKVYVLQVHRILGPHTITRKVCKTNDMYIQETRKYEYFDSAHSIEAKYDNIEDER